MISHNSNTQFFCLSVLFAIILFFPLLLIAQPSEDTTKVKIYVFELHEEIAPNAFRIVKRSVQEAEEMKADFIIMDLNTYGGRVDVADSIRTKLMRTETPTISFINNNAASAGALISIACDSIYMTSGANIGAATVVIGTGEEAPDKYQSYMRSTMRSTAEAQGRNPKIAEAMVDEKIEIPGVVEDGEVITFTTSEAIKNKYCEAQADSIDDIIKNQLQIQEYEIIQQNTSTLDRIIGFLLNPVVSSVLMLMMVGGIWFEIQTPGVGFPLIGAIIGATLYFMPLYIEGLAENWEIALFFLGLILLIIEAFVIPGFGLFGILGILAMITSLTMSLVDNNFFNFSNEGLSDLTFPLIRVLLSFIALIFIVLIVTPAMFKQNRLNRLVLTTTTSKEDGYTVLEKGLKELIGQKAIVFNDLKPMGRVRIQNEFYEARSIIGYVEKGAEVIIVNVDINNLIVRKL